MNGTCVSPTAARTGDSSGAEGAEAGETGVAGDEASSTTVAVGGGDEASGSGCVGGGGGEKSLGQAASALFRRSDAGLASGRTASGSSGSGGGSGRSQGIRKLQKCLSTSVSHYEGGGAEGGSSSGFAASFPFHAQRSVDVRGYAATTSSQASLTTSSPFILTNTRQYSSFGSIY